MAGRKPPTLTKEQSILLEHELLFLYSDEAFQRNLHDLWDKAGSDPLKQGRARQEACLPAQLKVIPKYGFEASKRGVCHSVSAFRPFEPDFDEMVRSEFMQYLINPGFQRLIDDPTLNLSGEWLIQDVITQRMLPTARFYHALGDRHFSGEHLSCAEIADTYIWGSFVRWRVHDMWSIGIIKDGWMAHGYAYKDSGEILFAFRAWREALPGREPVEAVPGPEETPVPLEHLDAACPIIYGGLMDGLRAPSHFLRSARSEEAAALIHYVREDPEGPFAGLVDDWPATAREALGGRWAAWNFEVGGEGERLLKADWHSVHGWGLEANAFVPRAASICALKRAPRRLLALLECFRDVNYPCWNAVLRRLESLRHEVDLGDPDMADIPWLVGVLSTAMRKRGHFGAMEAQVWWGDTMTTRSHKDGATSLLHLSITLSGRRSVRVGAFDDPLAPMVRDPCTNRREQENVWSEDLWYQGRLQTVDLHPGMVYCSAPFVFEHGVCYQSCDRQDPVIALQCRFAFPDLAEAERINTLRNAAMRRVATVVAETIKEAGDRGELRMPTCHEVQTAAHRIAVSEIKLSAGKREDWLFHEFPPPD
mmetsp:Transcript_78548/g.234129  ORF Transcript_78548/g.234129 Transcript_78548/m.234129 type:complete len:593 (+) Transcript_78548:154-1932(+)